MSTLDVVVRYLGDATQAVNSAKQVEDANSRLASSLGKTGAALTAGVTLPIVAMGAIAFKEFEQAGKVAAQTNAVLKSTGEVAHVSAKEVDALGTAILRKSGIDDEAVKSAENMLLTFTNVRNEQGKGNDIFTQATKITADLSVAMGKDMTSAAVLVGKALQDPVGGMTALKKVGVQLSQTQQQQIRDFAAVGDVASAQKVILRELQTQVGGSAEAYGKTMAGQMAIAKEEMLNAGAAIITVVAPALRVLAEVATTVAGAIQALPAPVQTALGVFLLLAAAVGPALMAISGIMRVMPLLKTGFEAASTGVTMFQTAIKAMSTSGLIALGVFGLIAVALAAVAVYIISQPSDWELAQSAAKKWGDTVIELGYLQDQQRLFNTEARMAAEQGDLSFQQVLKLKAKQEELGGAISKAKSETQQAAAAERERQATLNSMAVATDLASAATDEGIKSLQAYATQLLAAQGGSVGYEAAQIQAEQAQTKLNETLAKYPPESIEARSAANQFEQAQLQVANAAVKASTDQATFTKGLNQDAVPSLMAMRTSLEQTAAAHGDNTGAIGVEIEKINGYIATAQGIPPEKTTVANFEDAQARARMADYKRQIDALPAEKVTQLYAGIFGGVAAATGGVVSRPTILLAGEKGPEAIVPLGRSAAGRNAMSMSGGGGGNQTFNINIKVDPGTPPSQVGAAVVDQIRAYERLNGKSWRSS
jgi:hypothetical protein